MRKTWTVGVVEDNPDMQRTLASALARDSRWHLAFMAASMAEMRVRWATPGPDILLLDLGLPDGSGLDLLPQVRQHWPRCECLVVSMFGDEERVIRSIEAGAGGYILKGQGEADVAEHLGYLLEGGSPMSPAVPGADSKRQDWSAAGRSAALQTEGSASQSVNATPRAKPQCTIAVDPLQRVVDRFS